MLGARSAQFLRWMERVVKDCTFMALDREFMSGMVCLVCEIDPHAHMDRHLGIARD